MSFRNKEERLRVILDIAKKLKQFPKSGNLSESIYIDLWNSELPGIQKIKNEFNWYVNQDDTHKNIVGISGKVKCPEINKIIKYTIPIKKNTEPTFVLSPLF